MAKSKKRKRKWKLPALSLPKWDAVRTTSVALGWVIAAGALVVAWVLGVPRLEAYASARRAPDQIHVRFRDPPAWIRGELESVLLASAAHVIGNDPLRRDDLVEVQQTLLATGWFDEIRQVRRIEPETVEVDARFTTPFAVIRDESDRRDHLVDPRGRLLPRSFPQGGSSGFTVITGAQLARPARHGEPWPGADVTVALQLLQLFYDRPWKEQIAEVDVSQLSRTPSIRLRTDRDCIIIWGRPPGTESGSEVPAQRKLSYLDYHYQHYGHVDRGFLRELDITGDVVVGK